MCATQREVIPSEYNALGMHVKHDIEALARCKRRNLDVNELYRK
jgi:hypothetical protein